MNFVQNIPVYVWVIAAVLAVVAIACRLSGKGQSAWGDNDYPDDVDIKQLGEPVRVRYGTVLERSEVQVPKFYGNRMHRPQQVLETQLKFVVRCHDKAGDERIEVMESKTGDNAYANIGRSVEVRSYRSSVHSEDACDRVVVVG